MDRKGRRRKNRDTEHKRDRNSIVPVGFPVGFMHLRMLEKVFLFCI